MMKTKIGHILASGDSGGLESLLRLHGLLVERSLAKRWRFKGQWVTTGPLETLMGFPGCGSSVGDLEWCRLRLRSCDRTRNAEKEIHRRILEAMCEYPGLAEMNEDVSIERFLLCREFFPMDEYEYGQTRRRLNGAHGMATQVRGVRLECRASGIYLCADVVLESSSWGLFWLAKEDEPKWNMRLHLDTWLERAMGRLDLLVKKTSLGRGRKS